MMPGTATAMSRLVIRVDAGPTLGLGHAVRCAALSEVLGAALVATVVGAGAVLPGLFPGRETVAVDADDDDGFAQILAGLEPAAVVIDHPWRNGSLSRLVRRAAPGARVAVIDDEGGDLDADLVVNGTVLDEYHRYTGLPSRAELLVGPRHALLRPAFGRTPWRAGGNAGTAADSGVIMVVGSGECAARWAFFLASDAVDRAGWGRPRLVVGAAFPEPEALAAACTVAGIDLMAGLGGEDLAVALASAPVALITGGMIVYEALAVGVPAVVYPQLPNLCPEARWLAARGCLVDLGAGGGFDAGAIRAAVMALVADRGASAAMSRCQRRLIDGRGVERMAASLLARLARQD
jgi:spore coat polysaccharide biosynthesis predicted glycosyltransferase SpsG